MAADDGHAMNRPDVLVLCLHAVSERWPAALSMTPGMLRAGLEHLVERGYRGATFSQAVTDPPGTMTLAVTFDDAYRSVLELASPILRDLGLPGTVFVPTDFPERRQPMSWPGIDQWLGGPYEAELTPLDWSEIAALAASGWEVGSHTRSHPHLPALGDAALDAELHGSRRACEERLGHPCRSLAYPYGAVDDRVAAAARRAGYETAGTLPKRLHRSEPLLWPRVGVYRGDDLRRFKLKVSPSMRRLRASPVWSLLDHARRGGTGGGEAGGESSGDGAHPHDGRAPGAG